MKSCIPICLIAFALLGFFLGSQFVKLRGNLFTQFKNTLNSFQLGIYKEIIRERACIFSFGLLFGIIIATIFCYHLYYNNKLITRYNKLICFFISITLFTSIMVYTLFPKSKYMLSYLTNQNQISAWLNIYKSFRHTNYLGILLGILVFYVYQNFQKK